MRDQGCRAVDNFDRQIGGLVADRPSHSFETTPDGRIPIATDWKRVLQRMSIPRHLFIRVDHAYGRMSMRLRRQNVLHSLAGHYLKDGFELNRDLSTWVMAHARLEQCQCCGSPGGLHIADASARTFLQIDPPSDFSPTEWAEVLKPIATHASWERFTQNNSAQELMIRRPAGATDLGISGLGCVELFQQLAERSIEVEFTIYSNGICLRQSYQIDQLNESHGILECLGSHAGLSVYLPRVIRTSVMYDQGRLTLYMIGPDEEILFTVRAALNARSEPDFHSLMGL